MSIPPPPPPGSPSEPLQPILIPAGSSMPAGSTVPSGSPTRSVALLLGVAIAAAVLLVVNSVGLAGFPSNAPVEAVYALGLNVDLFAIIVTCVIGALLSRRRYPLRARTPLAIVAIVLAGAAFAAWIVFGGIGSIVELIPPDRGRYMYAAGGLFYAGAPFALAAIFGAHAYRRGGDRINNALAVAALGVIGLLAVYAVVSSVIYGQGLTD